MIKTRAFQYAVGGGLSGLALASLIYNLEKDPSVATGIAVFAWLPLFLMISGFLAGSRIDAVRAENGRLNKGITDAEERLESIALAAVTNKGWDVEIEDSYIPTCWELLDCSAAECPVFRKKNIRCWFIAGTYCGGEAQGTFAQKLGSCSACEVYKQAVDNHPVGRIRENFNNLLWVVDEKARLLASTNDALQKKYEELEQLQAETQYMAETDALTGLYNYGHFNETLKREVTDAKRYGKVLTLMMLDFNNFKKINEHYGYRKGDSVLVALADHLRREVRPGDYIARYGNEEFVIILSRTDGEVALALAEKIAESASRIADDLEVERSDVSISIGVADFPDCAHDNQSLIAAADASLFFAKKNNNGIAYFCNLADDQLTDDDVQMLQSRLRGVGVNTLTALAKAVDATDHYPEGDQNLLAEMAEGMAKRLGMDDDESELLVVAAKIHDIGKIGVPVDVLTKTDKLSPIEVDMVKRHPEIGQELLREARQIQELVLAILYHHERWDGNGYPEGLEGRKIPRLARIVGIFDAYRAMRCDRPYRKAMSKSQAIAELRKGAGVQFDPELVDVFIDQLRKQNRPGLREVG